MTDAPIDTQVMFKLAQKAADRGYDTDFFERLKQLYHDLDEHHDWDLDIDIGPPDAEVVEIMTPGDDKPVFTMMFNGNGLEAAQPDEAVEETYFRLIIESGFFDNLDPNERELFLIGLMQEMLTWLGDRHNY